jgi:polygalacturonase
LGEEKRIMIKEYKEFKVSEYGAKGDGFTLNTEAIQKAIDEASLEGGLVTFEKGIYLTGSIFLKSKVELVIGEDVEIRGTTEEKAYPDMWSRVAGIEMEWPAGLINIVEQKNVKICGKGTINGQGEYWWNKYWGEDKKGGMRKGYTERGLRWAVDYDCKRPRNVIVLNSSQVSLESFTSIKSGFWNIHICYSDSVYVDGITVKDNKGPSTDGVDIDSSSNVLVENCYIDCNDDNFCIKAGRDADGLRVNRVCENIVIRNCETARGGGITLGSETSGGMRNIEIYNIKAKGTQAGLRFKSASTRGGLIENIKFHNIELIDVRNPFVFQLNWYPSYSYAAIPEDFEGEIPAHWHVMAKAVEPAELGIPEFKNISIWDVTAKSVNENSNSKAFEVDAYPSKPIKNIQWKNVYIEANKSGSIVNAKDWTMENVVVKTVEGEDISLENCENVQLPEVEVLA